MSEKTLKQIQALIARYAYLDDAKFILKTSTVKYNALVNEYFTKLNKLWLKDTLPTIDKLVKTIDNSIYKDLKKYFDLGTLNKPKSVKKLSKLLQKQFATDFQTTMTLSKNALINKKNYLDINFDARTLSKTELNKINGRQNIIKIDDSYVTEKTLKKLDSEASRLYGSHDTVKYKSDSNNGQGVNYPLISHIENKNKTLMADTERATQSARAHELGVYTVKVSSHNGKYSCAVHEGRLCFVNDEARQLLFNDRPDLRKILSNLKTIDDLKNDKTRIFKFNCSHTYNIYPLQFMSPDLVQEDIDEYKPKKIKGLK